MALQLPPWRDMDEGMRHYVARVNPATMARYLNPDWQVPPHVWLMATQIAAAVEKGNGRIIIEMPPRHSKSETGSHYTPVWFLENWPDKRVVITSYGHEKAIEWGEEVRNTFRDNHGPLLAELAPDSTAKATWKTTMGGKMRCVGVGGALTGFGYDLGICDDPSKDDVEATSEVYRERKWQWWTKVFLTRAMPGATIILIGTRWHEDDLIGRVKRQEAELAAEGVPHDQWRVIRFPCIAEEHDELNRKPGQALWPEFGFDEAWAEKQSHTVGSRAWAALYQQRPAPEGGGMFRAELFRYWTRDVAGNFVLHHREGTEIVPPTSCWIGQTVDTAMKDKTINDWTVVLTFAVTPKRQMLLLEVKRARLEIPDQLPFLRECRGRWKPRWTGVEEKASGIGLIQEARRQGVYLKPLKAEVNKVARAVPASVLYEQGAIFHPQDATWLADFEHELLTFPYGAHDDQVDTLAHAANEMGGAHSGPAVATLPVADYAGEAAMAAGGKPW